MAEAYTAGSLLVPVRPDARGAATKVRREFETMKDPVVKIDADIRELDKKLTQEKAKLDQLQARKVDPKLDLDIQDMEAKLAQANARLDELRRKPTSPKVDADILAAEAKVARVTRSLETLHETKASPKIDLDIANSEARLAGLSAKIDQLRAERAEIAVDADTAGAMWTLSGFRAAAQRLVGNVEAKVDVDTSGAIVQIASLSRALGTLSMPAAALGALPFLASLGSTAVTTAGSLWLLPGAMGGAAVAMGALKVASLGVGDALKYAFDPEKAEQFQEALAKLSPQAQASVLAIQGLSPALTAVRTSAQDALFSGLAPLITSLGSQYLPLAEVTFTRIAGSVNTSAVALGDWLQTAQGIATVRVIADGAALAFDNVMRAAAPLARAFLNIAAIGTPVLVQLTAGAEGVAQRFASWTSSAQGVQTITAWIWNAIGVLRQLWALALNVGSILGSVFAAGAASGESFLGVLVRVTGGLAAALRTPEGAAGLTEFFTAIRSLVQGFVDKLVILWPAVVAAGQALAGLLGAAGPLTEVFLQLAVWALVPLLDLITALSPILGPMIAVFVAMRVATAAWAATQWLLNAALSANPIGLVILAVTALVAAVVYAYQNFDWFRNIVDACWRGIVAAAQWAWTNILQPIFSAIVWWIQNVTIPVFMFYWNIVQAVWNGIAAAVSFVWNSVLSPIFAAIGVAWSALVTGMQWAWANILKPVFDFIGLAARVLFAVVATALITPLLIAWNGLMTAMQWAWANILLPCWQALQAAATWMWVNVLQPVFAAIGVAWNALLAGINWAWLNILKPCWDALIAALNWLYVNVWVPIMTGLGLQWQAFVNGVNWVWLNILKPCWDALIAALNWLYHNVWVPIMTALQTAWRALGDGINWVWLNVIKPAWDAVAGGLTWLRDRFNDAVNWIGDIWNRIRGLLARPINFMIDVVWNRGVVPAWNAVAGLVGLGPVQPLGLIPEMATGGELGARKDITGGGRVRGPGTATSDDVPLWGSRGEFMVRAKVARQTAPFLHALNSGDGEAIQAAGGGAGHVKSFSGTSGLGLNPMTVVPRYAVGGMIEERIAAAKAWLSGPARGSPYVYGGGTNPRQGMDCSSMQSAVTHILSGRPPDSGRIGATSTMPWAGFVGGINGAYAIGNKPNDHMAATLGGQNVEQHGPSGTPFQFPSRWGADNGYFTQQYHLGEVGGQFVSGGAGGGGGGFNPIRAAIEAVFGPLKDALVGTVTGLVGEPPPEWRRVPPAFTGKAVDALRDFLLSKADIFGGGAAMGATSDEAPAIVRIISDVARGMFGGLARDAATIGVATGLVESDLRNLAGGDRDSVGVFQQRPSQGWGSIAECMNVTHAAGNFFSRFPPDWHSRDPGMVAQGVQRSAFPLKYGQRMGQARGLVNQFGAFDAGGVARGRGVLLKDVIAPERVLDPVETRQYDTLGPLVREMEAGRLPSARQTLSARQIASMGPGAGRALEGVRISGHIELDPDMAGGWVDGRIDNAFGELAGITRDRS